ncbi:MAG TPA: hypothetical protein VHC22_08985 [Pirellulales bacterium]|nr:hypothetical protein [Pirellulales bacterium]
MNAQRYVAILLGASDQSPEGGRVMLIDLEEGSRGEFAGGAPRVTASRMAWRLTEE